MFNAKQGKRILTICMMTCFRPSFGAETKSSNVPPLSALTPEAAAAPFALASPVLWSPITQQCPSSFTALFAISIALSTFEAMQSERKKRWCDPQNWPCEEENEGVGGEA